MVKSIEIKKITDSYDCDDCGGSWSYGWVITDKDTGAVLIDKTPSAHCFGGTTYYEDDMVYDILKVLGVEYAVLQENRGDE